MPNDIDSIISAGLSGGATSAPAFDVDSIISEGLKPKKIKPDPMSVVGRVAESMGDPSWYDRPRTEALAKYQQLGLDQAIPPSAPQVALDAATQEGVDAASSTRNIGLTMAALRGIGQGASFGASDVMSAAASDYNTLPETTAEQWTQVGGSLGGGLVSGGIVGKAIPAIGAISNPVVRGAAEGAISNLAYVPAQEVSNVMEGRDITPGSVAIDSIIAGGLGAGLGAGVGYVGSKIAGRLKKPSIESPPIEPPTPEPPPIEPPANVAAEATPLTETNRGQTQAQKGQEDVLTAPPPSPAAPEPPAAAGEVPRDLFGNKVAEPATGAQRGFEFGADTAGNQPTEQGWLTLGGKLRPDVNKSAESAMSRDLAETGQMTFNREPSKWEQYQAALKQRGLQDPPTSMAQRRKLGKELQTDKTLADLKKRAASERMAEGRQMTGEVRAAGAIGELNADTLKYKPVHELPPDVAEAIQGQAQNLLNETKSKTTASALRKIIEDHGKDKGAIVEEQKQRIIEQLTGRREIGGGMVLPEAHPAVENITDPDAFNFGANVGRSWVEQQLQSKNLISEPTKPPDSTIELGAGLMPKQVIDAARKLGETSAGQFAKGYGNVALNTTTKQLRNLGPGGDILADGLLYTVDRKKGLEGRWITPIEDALKYIKSKYGLKGVRQAEADYARANEAHLTYQPRPTDTSEPGHILLNAFDRYFVDSGELATQLGVQSFDPVTGGKRPMQAIGSGGFHRNMKPEMAAALRNPNSPEYFKATKYMQERSMSAEEISNAIKKLTDPKMTGYFPGLEKQRGPVLPPEFYEFSFKKTAYDNIRSAAKRLADIETFGQMVFEPEGVIDTLRKFPAGFDRDRASKILLAYLHPEAIDPRVSKGFSVAGAYNAATKIGLSAISPAKNAAQTLLNTWSTFGIKALAKSILHLDESIRLFHESGEAQERFLQAISGEAKESDSIGKVAAATMKGFNTVERSNRVLASGTAANWTKDAMQQLKEQAANPPGPVKNTILKMIGADAESLNRQLDRMRVNKESLKNNKYIDPEDLYQAARGGTTQTQFSTEFPELPLWANHDYARPWRQFKTFSYQQARFFNNTILTELRHGNMAPAVRFLIAIGVTGEAVNALVDLIHKKEPRTIKERQKSVQRIQKWVKSPGVAKGLQRYWEDVTMSGALGLIGDAATATGNAAYGAWDRLKPVAWQSAENLIKMMSVPFNDKPDKLQQETKLLGREVSAFGQARHVIQDRKIGPKALQDAVREPRRAQR